MRFSLGNTICVRAPSALLARMRAKPECVCVFPLEPRSQPPPSDKPIAVPRSHAHKSFVCFLVRACMRERGVEGPLTTASGNRAGGVAKASTSIALAGMMFMMCTNIS